MTNVSSGMRTNSAASIRVEWPTSRWHSVAKQVSGFRTTGANKISFVFVPISLFILLVKQLQQFADQPCLSCLVVTPLPAVSGPTQPAS